jgi:hypothetical protein
MHGDREAIVFILRLRDERSQGTYSRNRASPVVVTIASNLADKLQRARGSIKRIYDGEAVA